MPPRGGKKKRKSQTKNNAKVENENPGLIIQDDNTQQRESRAQNITPEDQIAEEISVGQSQQNAQPNECIRPRQPLQALTRQVSQQDTPDFSQQVTRDFTQQQMYDSSQQCAQDFPQQNRRDFSQQYIQSTKDNSHWTAEDSIENLQRLKQSLFQSAQQYPQIQQQTPQQHLRSPVPNPEQNPHNSQQKAQQPATELRNEVLINKRKEDANLLRLSLSFENHFSSSQLGTLDLHSQNRNILRLNESEDEGTRPQGEVISLPRQGAQAPIGTIDRHSQRRLFDTPEQQTQEISVDQKKPAEKKPTIMYQNRDILDLGRNLFGEFKTPVYWNDYQNRMELFNSK